MAEPLPSLGQLIAQKEQEIAQLRDSSVRQLEDKLRQREKEAQALQDQLAALQQDFEHNLQLLDGRDAELRKYEAALQQAAEQAEETGTLVESLHQAICEAEAALLAESESRARAEVALQQQRRALMQELADTKAAAAHDLEQAQRAAAAQCSALEAQLSAAELQLQKRLGRMEKEHAESVALSEARHTEQVAVLELRIKVLEQLGLQREEDLKAAQQELQAQTAHAATASARLQDLQREAKGLASKAEAMQKAHRAELLKRKQEKDALEQQLVQQLAHGVRASELEKVVEGLQATIAQRKAEAVESSKVQAAQQAQVALLEGRLADATAEVARLGNDLEEARAALEMQHGVLQEQLQRILDEKEGQLQALQDALTVQQRQFQAEAEQLHSAAAADKEDLHGMAQQLAVVEAYAHQQEQELSKCRESLAAANAAFHQQQIPGRQAPDLDEWEAMLRRVTLQRDEAQNTAKDCQAKLTQRELELQQLRKQLEASMRLKYAAASGDAAVDWAALESESLSSLPGSLQSASQPTQQAVEVLAQRRALEVAQAQNAQLQAALHALSIDMQQLQQAQGAQQQQQQALCDATNTQQGRDQSDLRRLRKEVGRLQSEVQRLSAENERLMEMSNSLRAERNKLAAGSGQLVPAAPTPAYAVLPVLQPLWLDKGQPQPLLLPRVATPVPSNSQMAAAAQPEPTSQLFSPQRVLDDAADSIHSLGVVGQQVAGSSGTASPPARRPRPAAVQKVKPQPTNCQSPPKPKVRNYNIKDD